MLTVDEVAQGASPPAAWPTSSFTRGRPRLVPAAAPALFDHAAAPAPTAGLSSSPRLSARLSTRARVMSMAACRRASRSGRSSEIEGGSSEVEIQIEDGAVKRRISLDMSNEGSLSRHASRIASSKGDRGGKDAGGDVSGGGKGGWSGLVFLMQKIVIPSKREGNLISVWPKAPMHSRVCRCKMQMQEKMQIDGYIEMHHSMRLVQLPMSLRESMLV